MFELPTITKTIDDVGNHEMAGGQYADSMSWTGDCCYGGK